MKHSVFTACMPDYTVDEAIDRLAEWGYDGVEWRVTNQKDSPDGKPGYWAGNRCTIPFDDVLDKAESIGKRCRAKGLEVAELGSYVKCHQSADAERIFEACRRMGAPQARIQAPGYDGKTNYRKVFDQAAADYAVIEKLARKAGVRANIELHMGNIVPSASAAYRLVSRFDPKCIGIIHDAGNMAIEGFENWRFGLELLGEYLAVVHVKNMAWAKGDVGSCGQRLWTRSWSELKEGQVNWADVVSALKAVGYSGWLSIEDFSLERATDAKLIDALKFLKDLEAAG